MIYEIKHIGGQTDRQDLRMMDDKNKHGIRIQRMQWSVATYVCASEEREIMGSVLQECMTN